MTDIQVVSGSTASFSDVADDSAEAKLLDDCEFQNLHRSKRVYQPCCLEAHRRRLPLSPRHDDNLARSTGLSADHDINN